MGATKVRPAEVATDQAPVYPTLLEERLPAAWHRTDRYANNRVEADHGRLKARLRPMRGLKQDRSAGVVIAGHALVQSIRRGHYELAVEEPANRRLAVAFDELILAIWSRVDEATSVCPGPAQRNCEDRGGGLGGPLAGSTLASRHDSQRNWHPEGLPWR
jgi:hypothetical protein